MSATRAIAERIAPHSLFHMGAATTRQMREQLIDAIDAALIAYGTERGLAARERAAKIAEAPYGDEVQALGKDEPRTVGEKIAAAIREGKPPE